MRRIRDWIPGLTFKSKLLMVMVALSILPIPVFGLFSYYTISHSTKEEVDRNHQMILNQIESHVDRLLQSLGQSSLELASNPSIVESVKLGISIDRYLDESLAMMETLQRYRSYSDIYFDVSVVYSKYDKVYSNRYGYINLSDFPYREALTDGTIRYSGFVAVSPHTYPKQDEILIARPIVDGSATGVGMLFLHVSTVNLTNFLKQLNIGGKMLFIFDSEGKLVAGSNAGNLDTGTIATVGLHDYGAKDGESSRVMRWNGVDYDLSARKSSLTSWTYMTMTPTSELNRTLDWVRNATWLMVALLSAFWGLLAFVGSNRLYVPIKRLASKFSLQPVGGRDELKLLDETIGEMRMTNERLQSELSEQLPLLKESVFLRMLRGEMSESEFRLKSEHYGFPLKGSWFYCCVVEIDQFLLFQQTYRDKDRSLIMYALGKMTEELSGEAHSGVAVITRAGQVTLILGMERSGPEADRVVRGIADTIRRNVSHYFRFTVSVAIDEARPSFHGLAEGYREAASLIGYRLLLGTNVTIERSDVESLGRQSSWNVIAMLKAIVQSIAAGDFAQAEEQLDELTLTIPLHVQSTETALALFASFLAELDSFVHSLGYGLHELFDDDPYKHLYGLTSLDEVKIWLTDTVFRTMRERLDTLRTTRQKRLLRQVLAYIHEHFETDLSLQTTADHFGVSTGQIGRAFKEELDTNFTRYLIEYRIDKAKEWLIHTEMPIKEMTERLRYTSVHNFTRIFTKTVGMPPGQFRKMARSGEIGALGRSGGHVPATEPESG